MSNWVKNLSIDKRIISHLSGSTYEGFPSALKELIINSYDADATEVKVNIDLKKEIITIEDNGKGMSEVEFNLYLRIAGQSRKKGATTTDKGRQIVGKFGVGFLSVFPFCKIYDIETSKRGTQKVIKAKIDCQKYFDFDSKDTKDINDVPIYGGEIEDPKSKSRQFTKIKLIGFTNLLKRFFNKEYEAKNNKRKNTIRNKSPLDLIKWNLEEYLPIKFKNREDLDAIFNFEEKIPFNVFFQNKQLYRPLHAKNILAKSGDEFEKIGKVKFKYFIATNFETVKPTEARFLLIRNLNVGVGGRTSFSLNKSGRIYGKLAWLTMDVNVVEGLNDLITISRDKFSFSTDFERFKDYLEQIMKDFAYKLDTIQELQNLILSDDNQDEITDFGDNKNEKANKLIKSLKEKGVEVSFDKPTPSNKNNLKKNENLNKEDTLFPTKEGLKVKHKGQESKVEKKASGGGIKVNFEKKVKKADLKISDKEYHFKYTAWEGNELFPACKIEGEVVQINKSFNLFKNNKYLDFFVKLNIMLIENYHLGQLDDETLISLNKSIQIFYSNYK